MVKLCEDMIRFSEDFAKRWLPIGSMKGRTPTEIDNTIRELVRGDRYRLHASVINYKEAKDVLKMNVKYVPLTDPSWALVWEYYLRVALTLQSPNAAKVFESAETSTTMNIQVVSQLAIK
jgi:hypothetical protein